MASFPQLTALADQERAKGRQGDRFYELRLERDGEEFVARLTMLRGRKVVAKVGRASTAELAIEAAAEQFLPVIVG